MAYKSLDNILSEDSNTEAEIRPSIPDDQPAEEKGVQPQSEPEPEGEPDGQEVPPSSDKLPEDVYKPLKAVRDENKALKDQLEALRKEVQAKPKEPEAPPPSMWEDEQGWQQHFGGQVVSQAVQRATFEAKLNQSEFYARKNIDRFEDSWEDLNKWLTDNPHIAQQATADIDPWGFAYRQFNNQRQLAEIGDVESYKAKLREELMAELQAQQPAQPQIPPSLSTQRSVSARSGPAWSGPPALGDLLK